MIYQAKIKILENKKVGENYYLCALKAGRIAKLAQPGQFLNVKLSVTGLSLLRRPLSVHRIAGEKLELLYEVVGAASGILSRKKKGEYLDVLGPLGNGFNLKAKGGREQNAILVAGGMGVAPLLYLAQRLKYKGLPVLIGARSRKLALCKEDFKALGCQVKIATDDGTEGFKGRVTDLLKKVLLSSGRRRPCNIYACGPRPMLRELCRIASEYNIPAQVSLEEHVACGFGACLGCAVNTIDGYRRVCKDGPVFAANQIIWRGL